MILARLSLRSFIRLSGTVSRPRLAAPALNAGFRIGMSRLRKPHAENAHLVALLMHTFAPPFSMRIQYAAHRVQRLGEDHATALERALAELVLQKQREQWLNENKHAIDKYNNFVEENGVFSDGLRSF